MVFEQGEIELSAHGVDEFTINFLDVLQGRIIYFDLLQLLLKAILLSLQKLNLFLIRISILLNFGNEIPTTGGLSFNYLVDLPKAAFAEHISNDISVKKDVSCSLSRASPVVLILIYNHI